MDFENLVTAYQIQNKCTKAAAIRAIARSHEREHGEYIEGLRQKAKPQEATDRPQAPLPKTEQQGHKEVKYVTVTREEAVRQIEEQVKREAEALTDEAKAKYCKDFLLGMQKRHAEGLRRDLAAGKLNYDELFLMVRSEELKGERGLLD